MLIMLHVRSYTPQQENVRQFIRWLLVGHFRSRSTFLFMFVKCSGSIEIIFSTVGTPKRLANLVRRSQVRHQVLLGFVDAITQLTDELKQKKKADSVRNAVRFVLSEHM